MTEKNNTGKKDLKAETKTEIEKADEKALLSPALPDISEKTLSRFSAFFKVVSFLIAFYALLIIGLRWWNLTGNFSQMSDIAVSEAIKINVITTFYQICFAAVLFVSSWAVSIWFKFMLRAEIFMKKIGETK